MTTAGSVATYSPTGSPRACRVGASGVLTSNSSFKSPNTFCTKLLRHELMPLPPGRLEARCRLQVQDWSAAAPPFSARTPDSFDSGSKLFGASPLRGVSRPPAHAWQRASPGDGAEREFERLEGCEALEEAPLPMCKRSARFGSGAAFCCATR